MKKEMIKFVEENFEVIKNQFSTFEYDLSCSLFNS
jgi:hypothetical protein